MTALPAAYRRKRAGQWIAAVAALAAAILCWGPLRTLTEQVLLSLLLCVPALPLCRRLETRLTRQPAALLSVSALAAGAAGLLVLLTPPLVAQITLIVQQIPHFLVFLGEIWNLFSQWEWVRALGLGENGPEQWLEQAARRAADSLPGLISGIAAGVSGVSRAFLAPVLAYYFLRDREAFSYRLSLWIPLKFRKRALATLKEMRREAVGYARGQALVSLAVAALTALGLLLTGIPAWLALGLIMGLCEWIPYVGPLIGGVPIVLFALPMGMSTLLWAVGITAAVQQIEGYFLSPRLMGQSTGLHPAAVLALLSVGSLLGGLPGMMAAIPAFVCLRGAARVLYETRKESPLA